MISSAKKTLIASQHPKTDLKFIDQIHSIVETMNQGKTQATITAVAEKLKTKRNQVARAIEILEEAKCVKRTGSGFSIPFLIVTDHTSKSEFIRGKEERDATIKRLQKETKEELSEQEKRALDSNWSKNLNLYNQTVKKLWAQGRARNCKMLRMGSTAIRYEAT